MRDHDIPSVCVVGNGYVGTVVAASFAALGRAVVGLESDPVKLVALRSGRAPFHEPGLNDLLGSALEGGGLVFTDDPEQALAGSTVVFVTVGSPAMPDGSVDLRPLESATRGLAPWLRSDHVLVVKSTVPVGTNAWLRTVVRQATRPSSGLPPVVSNPEFLRQGSAVRDFLHPDRIVLGGEDHDAVETVARVYRVIVDQSFPGGDEGSRPALIRTTPEVAEAAKYAANAFLAAKVSFINEIANICDRVGADVTEIARVMGLDRRIGREFLQAGLGWGGSCFAKDLDALVVTAREVGYEPQLLQAVRDVNERQRDVVIAMLRRHIDLMGAHVALLGLSFKPGTDDLRGAPAVALARRLRVRGATVSAFDPVVGCIPGMPFVAVAADPYEAARGADAVVIVTDWPELRSLDLARLRSRMRGDVLVDGRNVFHPEPAARAGLVYEGVGRGANGTQRHRIRDRRGRWTTRERSREATEDELEAIPGRRVS